MKAILDRHAEGLTPEERGAIWEAISGAPAGESQPTLGWALFAATATVVVAVATVAVLQRDAVQSRHSTMAGPVEVPSKVDGSAPRGDRTHSGAERVGALLIPNATITRAKVLPDAPDAPVAADVPEVGEVERRDTPPARSPIANGGTGVVTGRITDSQNRPVAYANVMLLGTRMGAMSGEDGTYRIEHLPPATYSLRIQALGYERQIQEGLRVGGDQPAIADIQIKDVPVKQLEEINVSAERRLDTKSSTTRQSISAERLRELPVDNLRPSAGAQAPGVALNEGVRVRGGRSGEVPYHIDAVQAAPAPPPVIPTTGGTRLPNDESYDSMFFKNYGVNPFIATDEDPWSTFAVDVDAASYTIARRYIGLGHLPPADAVRVEEFINYLPQGYPRFGSEDFRILMDGAPSPFGRGYHLLRIGLKGREIEEWDRKPARLTFVIDISGSMAREDRLELVKRALRLLVDRLHDDDRVGIVVYGTMGRVLLEPVALGGPDARAANVRSRADDEEEARGARGPGRRRILEAIEQLRPEGSTNAEDGLRLGYDMAVRELRRDALNRIVLCSDGVANVGMTGPESILERVRTQAARGIHLTTIGFGMGNYNDVLMEQLADRGDGNYYYVDDLDEARRVFVENLAGTLQVIAKDAKVQVEFDSTRVLRYRLLGFENRDVADRDFRNDKVDAGEIGAGHEVTALYEVKLAPQATQGTIATVRLRYARPGREGGGATQVREIERRFDDRSLARTFEDASPRFRLDAAVAEFAEILRGSYWAKEGRLSDVLSVARRAARSLRDSTADEVVSLVGKAATLKARSEPEPRGEEP